MPKSTTRQRARRRYWDGRNKHQYECPDCGRRLSQLRTGFEVHHKDGDPDNNDPDNLVALCRACHNLREQKKPSLNEIELLRDQVDGPTGLTPLVETPEGATAVYQASKEAGQPQMMLRQIKRRKYVELEEEDLHFLDAILEGYDGIANVRREYRVVDGDKQFRILTSPSCLDRTLEVIRDLRRFIFVGRIVLEGKSSE